MRSCSWSIRTCNVPMKSFISATPSTSTGERVRRSYISRKSSTTESAYSLAFFSSTSKSLAAMLLCFAASIFFTLRQSIFTMPKSTSDGNAWKIASESTACLRARLQISGRFMLDSALPHLASTSSAYVLMSIEMSSMNSCNVMR